MKNILFLISMLFLFSCEEEEDFSTPFYFAENGVTVKAKDWVTAGTTGELNGITYIAIDDTLTSMSDFKSRYPEIDIELNLGISLEVYSIISATIFIEGSGG